MASKSKATSVDEMKGGEHILIIGGDFEGKEGTFLRLADKQAWVRLAGVLPAPKCYATKVNKENIQYAGPVGPCPGP